MSKKHDSSSKKKKSKVSHNSSSHSTSSSSHHVSNTQPSSNMIYKNYPSTTLPSNITLPVDQLISFAPECLLFTQLLEFEKKLDASINKRLVDMQESSRSRSQKNFKTLRLSIFNTYANQSAFYHIDNKSLTTLGEKPSWTLRIEGRLLDDSPNPLIYTNSKSSSSSMMMKPVKRKFSTFFKKVFIQIGHRDTCEWDKSQSFTETDGFEIKRTGNQEVDVKILMYLDHQPQRYKVLGFLSQILNIHTDTKPKIILAFWHYIKTNKLLDPDCKKINCDESLKSIFGVDVLQFNQIPQLLREHLSAPDPLEFTYTLKLSGDPRDYENAYDIQVEVDEPVFSQNNQYLKREVLALDDEINTLIQKINVHKRKREFMAKLADNPLQYINDTTQNLIKDYQILKSNASTGFEEERHTSFYYQPMTEELVSKYLAKQVTPTPTPQTTLPPSTPQTPSS
ncbi:hypothetical protein CYY_001254 [Polysphondylium violaceum]|uniref:DM2 domain-containing protein n=1 Tax=Polysphondylium violaceum TaxID=133409 RepID=A0A8J4Q1A8_9MYCE|nr:hypothetical protein CYY_001254 [Polysphondylium violaceum]